MAYYVHLRQVPDAYNFAVLKGSKRHFLFFTGETKTDYNLLLVTLIFGKITKCSAPNCPFTKLSCFLISVLQPCLILDNFFIFCRLEPFARHRQY